MAKEIPIPKKEPKVQLHTEKKEGSFSIFLLLIALVLIAAALVSYFNWFVLNQIVLEALLFFGGLIVLLMTFSIGYEKRHREILKRYL